jgi:hypothetical protein
MSSLNVASYAEVVKVEEPKLAGGMYFMRALVGAVNAD